jgi:hypothetical protein
MRPNQDKTEDSNKRDIRVAVQGILAGTQKKRESMCRCGGIKLRWSQKNGSGRQVLRMDS